MSTATPPTASNANVRIAFQITSELDRNAFTHICHGLLITDDGDGSTIPANLVAAVLTSIVKGLAFPNAYLAPKSLLQRMGGLRRLALNFVRFQSQLVPPTGNNSAAKSHVTLVHVAQHCSDLVTKWEKDEESTILSSMFRYFLDYYAPPIGEADGSSNPGGDEDTKPAAKPSVSEFVKLLQHTLECICFNTQGVLEDSMDFDYIWASVLNDPGTYTPLNDISQHAGNADSWKSDTHYQCPKCLKDFHFNSHQTAPASASRHIRACNPGELETKKRSYDDSLVTSDIIRQVAKELAWAFSQITYSPHRLNHQARQDNRDRRPASTLSDIQNHQACDRKERIINTAGCIDLVLASLLAPIITAPAEKRRRTERGAINPRLSVENEATAALSTMLNGSAELNLREKSKESLLGAASDLLSAVTSTPSPIQHKDIVASAQKIASSVLPFITKSSVDTTKKSSPASILLSFINSHRARDKNLETLKEWNNRTLSGKVQVALSSIPLALTNDQKALRMGWYIGKLQRNFFIDSLNDFILLSLSERKLLAPFEQNEVTTNGAKQCRFSVRAIVRINRPQKSQLVQRHALQISRVKNPVPTDTEWKDLKEWNTAISGIVSTTASIKPSRWLMNHLDASTTSISDGNGAEKQDWTTIILPVVKYFLAIVADDCSCNTDTCSISDDGEYKVQQDETTPGAVLQLYYWALESIIRRSTNSMLICNERFHSSLFSLCHFCYTKANHTGRRCFLIEDMGDCPIQFYRLIETFIHVLEPGSESVTMNRALALPLYVIRILCQVQELLLEMIWMTNDLEDKVEHTFVGMINELRENPITWRHTCPIVPSEESSTREKSREQMLVRYVLQSLIDVIKRRVATLCALLPVRSAKATTKKTMEVFKTMLHHRTDIFFDRHPDQLMLCSMYAAVCSTSAFAPKVNFQRIADAYMKTKRDQIGSEVSYAILHRIKNCSDHDDQFGDIISLYNEVFVPSMKPFWRAFKKGQVLGKPSESPTSSENAVDAPTPREYKEPREEGRDMDIETIENANTGINEVDLNLSDSNVPNQQTLGDEVDDVVNGAATEKNVAEMQTAPLTKESTSSDTSLLQEQKGQNDEVGEKRQSESDDSIAGNSFEKEPLDEVDIADGTNEDGKGMCENEPNQLAEGKSAADEEDNIVREYEGNDDCEAQV